MKRYVCTLALLYHLNTCIWQTTTTTVDAADVEFSSSPFHKTNDEETHSTTETSDINRFSSVRIGSGNTVSSLSSNTNNKSRELQPQQHQHHRYLTGTTPNDDTTNKQLCDIIYENNDNRRKLPTDETTITTSFLNRWFGWMSNGNILTRIRNMFRNGNSSDIRVPTTIILPKFAFYSNKLLSVARQIQNHINIDTTGISPPISSNNDDDDNTNLIAAMYNASAWNLILLSNELIHPIMTELSQREYIDITTMSCTMVQILSYIQDTTLPMIMSLTEIVYTKSNNVTIQNAYQTFLSKSAIASTTASTTSTTANANALRCSESHQLLSSDALSNARQDNLFPIVSWLSACNDDMTIPEHIAAIFINILLFPLSIVAGIITGILSLFLFVLPGRAPATILILTFGAPFFVGFFILRNIRAIFQDLMNPIMASDATRSSNDTILIQSVALAHLSKILDSPVMQSMITATMPGNDKSTDLLKMECAMKTLSCQNDAFMDILP